MLQLSFSEIKKAPVWLVEPNYSIGSAEDNDIWLEQDGIMAHHAQLVVEDEHLSIHPSTPEAKVVVDDAAVTDKTALRHGSRIQLGSIHLHIIDPKLARREKLASSEIAKTQGWYLKAKTTALANKNFDIQGPVVLGRAKECDICLAISHLSRKHALLTPHQDSVELEDLHSSNGTYVNGERVAKTQVRVGDEIRFDTLSFRVCHIDESEQDSGDKTSLRPAISEELLQAQNEAQPQARKAARSRKKKSAENPIPTIAKAEQEPSSTNSGLQIVVGVILVTLLTIAALLYLLS